MNKFYFTYGSLPQYPYGSYDYVVVFADNIQEAVRIYNAKYPEVTPGIVNCAFYYPQSEWDKIKDKYYPYPPVEVINRPSSKDALQELADYMISKCEEFELDNISLQVKRNGQVIAVEEHKADDGKRTFTRISRRDSNGKYDVI